MAQGLHQGLNLRDSGLDVSYALRDSAISEQRQSWKNATNNGFTVGNYQEMIPTADLVINLTPDKQALQRGFCCYAADEKGILPFLLPRLQHC